MVQRVIQGKNFRLIETTPEPDGTLHDYGIRPSAWYRAARLAKRFGFDDALELIEARAERALARGDLTLCVRWRDLIVAIHAVMNDEPLPTDRSH